MHGFEDAINFLTKQLDLRLNEKEIRDIAESLDINKDGFIDFNEFLEAFRIVDNTENDLILKAKQAELDETQASHVDDMKT